MVITETETTEHTIVALLAQGDKRAIDLIYTNYSDSLYGIALRMMRDEMSAMDVLQESFIKIWRKAESYDSSKARLFTWLLNVLRNTAIDSIRKRDRAMDREIQMDGSNVYNLQGDNLKPEHLDVQDQVEKLDPKYKEVIEAMFFMGMTQAEVSEHLAIPLGTVKTRMRIGLRELKEIFGVETIASVIAILLAS